VTIYGLEGLSSISCIGYPAHTRSGALPIFISSNIVDCLSRMKRAECETDESPQSRDKIKNEWGFTSTHNIRLHGVTRSNLLSLISDSVLGRATAGTTLKADEEKRKMKHKL